MARQQAHRKYLRDTVASLTSLRAHRDSNRVSQRVLAIPRRECGLRAIYVTEQGKETVKQPCVKEGTGGSGK